MKDYRNRFRQILERALPESARILMPEGGPDLIILATWRLDHDPTRPNKRSKLLRIVISEEALEDYARGSDGVRLASDERFLRWLHRKLADFDPDHDTPPGIEPLSVTYTLGTLELNN